jgi:hypothetical protein
MKYKVMDTQMNESRFSSLEVCLRHRNCSCIVTSNTNAGYSRFITSTFFLAMDNSGKGRVYGVWPTVGSIGFAN